MGQEALGVSSLYTILNTPITWTCHLGFYGRGCLINTAIVLRLQMILHIDGKNYIYNPRKRHSYIPPGTPIG